MANTSGLIRIKPTHPWRKVAIGDAFLAVPAPYPRSRLASLTNQAYKEGMRLNKCFTVEESPEGLLVRRQPDPVIQPEPDWTALREAQIAKRKAMEKRWRDTAKKKYAPKLPTASGQEILAEILAASKTEGESE